MSTEPLQGCSISVYQSDKLVMAELSGVLKLQNCGAVKNRVLLLLKAGLQAFYLHLGQVSEVDSAGLGVLVGLHMTARKNKIDFNLLSPTACQMKLLDATRLTQVLSIRNGAQAEEVWSRLARPEFSIPVPDPPPAE
jgi:anti-anti-sigma factor